MTSRLDVSPERRLRNLGDSLKLTDRSSHDAILRLTTGKPRAVTSREERIRKCAALLANTPAALDILEISLSKVIAKPNDERLRKVNLQGIFRVKVAEKNAAGVELLYACGYEPMHGYLVLQKHDAAILSFALNELSAARSLSTYVSAKSALDGELARQQASVQDATAAASRRATFLAKVPDEPNPDECGRASTACVISVRVATMKGGALPQDQPRVATRRFDADNTLTDLLNYIRSLPAVPEGALTVENVTTRPARAFDPEREGGMSLYALDLWPRGQVQVSA